MDNSNSSHNGNGLGFGNNRGAKKTNSRIDGDDKFTSNSAQSASSSSTTATSRATGGNDGAGVIQIGSGTHRPSSPAGALRFKSNFYRAATSTSTSSAHSNSTGEAASTSKERNAPKINWASSVNDGSEETSVLGGKRRVGRPSSSRSPGSLLDSYSNSKSKSISNPNPKPNLIIQKPSPIFNSSAAISASASALSRSQSSSQSSGASLRPKKKGVSIQERAEALGLDSPESTGTARSDGKATADGSGTGPLKSCRKRKRQGDRERNPRNDPNPTSASGSSGSASLTSSVTESASAPTADEFQNSIPNNRPEDPGTAERGNQHNAGFNGNSTSSSDSSEIAIAGQNQRQWQWQSQSGGLQQRQGQLITTQDAAHQLHLLNQLAAMAVARQQEQEQEQEQEQQQRKTQEPEAHQPKPANEYEPVQGKYHSVTSPIQFNQSQLPSQQPRRHHQLQQQLGQAGLGSQNHALDHSRHQTSSPKVSASAGRTSCSRSSASNLKKKALKELYSRKKTGMISSSSSTHYNSSSSVSHPSSSCSTNQQQDCNHNDEHDRKMPARKEPPQSFPSASASASETLTAATSAASVTKATTATSGTSNTHAAASAALVSMSATGSGNRHSPQKLFSTLAMTPSTSSAFSPSDLSQSQHVSICNVDYTGNRTTHNIPSSKVNSKDNNDRIGKSIRMNITRNNSGLGNSDNRRDGKETDSTSGSTVTAQVLTRHALEQLEQALQRPPHYSTVARAGSNVAAFHHHHCQTQLPSGPDIRPPTGQSQSPPRLKDPPPGVPPIPQPQQSKSQRLSKLETQPHSPQSKPPPQSVAQLQQQAQQSQQQQPEDTSESNSSSGQGQDKTSNTTTNISSLSEDNAINDCSSGTGSGTSGTGSNNDGTMNEDATEEDQEHNHRRHPTNAHYNGKLNKNLLEQVGKGRVTIGSIGTIGIPNTAIDDDNGRGRTLADVTSAQKTKRPGKDEGVKSTSPHNVKKKERSSSRKNRDRSRSGTRGQREDGNSHSAEGKNGSSGRKFERLVSKEPRRSSSRRRPHSHGIEQDHRQGEGGAKSSSLSSSSSGERANNINSGSNNEGVGSILPCSADVAAATLHHHHPDNWSRALLEQRRFMMPPRQQTSDLTVSSSLSVEATRASSSCSNSSYFALDDPVEEENEFAQGGEQRITIAIEGGMPGPQSYPQDGASPPLKDVGPDQHENHLQRKRRYHPNSSPGDHDRPPKRRTRRNPPSHDSSNTSPRTSSLSASSRTGDANPSSTDSGNGNGASCSAGKNNTSSGNSDETGCLSRSIMRGGHILSQSKGEGGGQIPAQWIKCYMELQHYHSLHGNCKVPLKRPLGRTRISKSLRQFVSEQRYQHRLLRRGRPSELTEERMRLLENLGFEWKDSKRDAGREKEEWRRRFEELRKFQCKYGHCRVPLDKRSPNLLLGIWVKNQRKQYRLYRKKKAQESNRGSERGSSSSNSTVMRPVSTSMTKERIRLLKSIGFEWRFEDEYEWKEKFAELQLYKSRHGNCDVPSRYSANAELGKWVRKQRKQYRLFQSGRKSSLNEEKVYMLEAIGFVWKSPSNRAPHDPLEEENWRRMYDDLSKFKSKNDTCVVPADHPDTALIQWVKEQQNQYIMLRDGKISTMNRERIRLLDKIGFCWPAPAPSTPSPQLNDGNDGNETAAVSDLSLPAMHNSTTGFPISSESIYTEMASSAADAAAPATSQVDTPKQASFLDPNPGFASQIYQSGINAAFSQPPVIDDPKWISKYNELLQYRRDHGDCRVPLRYSENPALGRWVSTQRRDYKAWEKDKNSSSLTEAKVKLLNSIGFIWFASGDRGWVGKRKAAQDKVWSTRYNELSQYKARFQDCRVPKTCHQFPSLRRWVDTQRSEFAKVQRGEGSPILTAERIRLLDALGFEWGVENHQRSRGYASTIRTVENGDGVSSSTQLSQRTSSLARLSSEVDFSSLTPSRSIVNASSNNFAAATKNEGKAQGTPKATTLVVGAVGIHSPNQHQHQKLHQHHRHHHISITANQLNQQPSPLPTEISFRKRGEVVKDGGK